jgi:hypothetical protein
LSAPQQPQYQQAYGPPAPQRHSHAGLAVGIVIAVVLIVILAIVFLPTLTSHATLKTRVYSNHLLFDIHYQLYLDGSLKKEGDLSPSQYVEYSFDVSPGSSCHDYNVFASATGGGMGATSDTETVNLCNGEAKSVDLHV